jgi:hypothetical protein
MAHVSLSAHCAAAPWRNVDDAVETIERAGPERRVML